MTTIHTSQLQQYTQSTNYNYIKDNLNLATKHPRQYRILQPVEKVKTPKQESTVYSFLYFMDLSSNLLKLTLIQHHVTA